MARRLVREVWQLADDELRRELELQRIREIEERGPQDHRLSLADVASSVLFSVEESKESQDDRPQDASSPVSIVDTTSSLEIRKVVALPNGFNISIGPRKNRKDMADVEHLRKVGICVGYITRDPQPSAMTRIGNAWSSPLPPIKREQQQSFESHAGELILMLVDSRKNWNFPYGKACDVDVVWPSSKGKSKQFCEIHVMQLRSFRTYKVTVKIDLEPLELFARTTVDIALRAFSFHRDTHELAMFTVTTEKSPPEAPEFVTATLLPGYESIDNAFRRRTVKIEFAPGDYNGGDLVHYDVQRLVILQSSYQNPPLSVMTWKPLAKIKPDSERAYFDSELVEPFNVQYRIRAVTDIGKGRYATSSEMTNASGSQLSPFEEYNDPLKPASHNPTLPNRSQLLLRKPDDGYNKLLGTLLERRSKINSSELDEGDREWLNRLTRASPFGI